MTSVNQELFLCMGILIQTYSTQSKPSVDYVKERNLQNSFKVKYDVGFRKNQKEKHPTLCWTKFLFRNVLTK